MSFLWTSDALVAATGGRPFGTMPAGITGISIDTRSLKPGDAFFAIKGDVHDGHDFATAAVHAGATLLVVAEGKLPALGRLSVPMIVVSDVLAALEKTGIAARDRARGKIIAVTGSVGKTTTKDILVAMLRAAGVRAEGTPGNRNTEVGVPMSLMGLPPDTEVAVVEMGMRGTGQIAELARLAPPRVACISAIAPVHLELLGTVEAIAAAKAEVFSTLGPGDTAVVPAGEPLLAPHLAALPDGVRVVEFADLPAGAVELSVGKAWQRRNAAAALACCEALGMAPPPGTRVEVELSAMRGQEHPLAVGGTLIEDCYNANPVAMRAALTDLAGRSGRRVAVLGDMFELGPDELAYHRQVGELVAELGVDLLVAVGSRAEQYAAGAAGVPSHRFADAAEAAAGVPGLLREGDVVLVKASRGMALEAVANAVRER